MNFLSNNGQRQPGELSADGNLKITDAENALAIAMGNVTGSSVVHKFGKTRDFDSGDGYVTIWDGADDALYDGSSPMNYTYSTSADIDSISSSDNSDTEDIYIEGCDANYNLVTQTVTLTGQTRAALSTPLMRVWRMRNDGTSDLAGKVYCYVNGDITLGVPDTATDVRAIIHGDNNQTLMAVYTIPLGYTGYICCWYASLAGAVKDSIHDVQLRIRAQGGIFQLKRDFSLNATGTSHIPFTYDVPKEVSAKSDIELRVNTDTNSAAISGGFDIVLVAD